jgi:tetratricopeptide (TPR) repeat protein
MSMTREQMLHYMENPDQLNEKNLVELKEILDEYPYFQSAHLLYIRNLANEKNFRFANQLKVSAVHATDRTVLYHLLNTQKKEKEIPNEVLPTERQQETEEKKNSIIEASYRLEGEIDSEKTLGQLVKDINESAIKNRSELFQNFAKQNIEEEFFSDEETVESDNSDEFITETLARIYIKQGLYGKAIDAFQRLKLKYPEKSIYFAKQIEEVTNLLNK